MHELSLCRNIIKIVQDHAERHQKKRVFKITILIGDLLAVDCKALAFWFNVVAQGTVAEDAKLDMINVIGTELVVKSMEAE
ncbi:hydrogenase maturation nickel metallochaperone HypA/HybF [Aquicella lusitana]|uniref:Hydrogenase nickel insertion protein HypA n=1 Tax=Aquicella lusitana TaxID=254246 RepID=A0A370GJK3_9COXI|nr:hydrogenase maturation nickel metallochaperone HypA [Aquicella lusitana]RDI43419.1 hydrogenase nickel insertion protein HypA [Aquicella lusitana]VVC73569.1 hydrogenase nickel incorporation protein HypA [Aquicella lusitana]